MGQIFGGLQGRILGGKNSQINRRKNPEYYRKLGCNIAILHKKARHSPQLAEIVGIILGDGGITHNQLKVTLNSIKDYDYSLYVMDQLKKTFGLKVGCFKKKDSNAIDIYISSVNLVVYLTKLGLIVGDKTKHQVDVPKWVKDNITYSKHCLRGLMDTDGGIFRNTYISNHKKYSYLKACFTNYSKPLIRFANETLIKLNYSPSVIRGNKVWISSQKQTFRYLKEIGTSNVRLSSVAGKIH